MTGIKSSVGLISGIDYTTLVDQLIALDGVTRDNLVKATTKLNDEKKAIDNLRVLFMTSSFMISNLNRPDPYNRCDVSSSSSALTATKTGTPIAGAYTFTPLRTASSQQTVAQGVVSDTQALGKKGTITIGSSWTTENKVELKDINGGDGFTKGHIRITDGSGTRATIDLRSAVTMNDIVETINSTHTIDVFAEIDGDRLKLTDMSGMDKSELIVQEVTGGKTAASLGLAGCTATDGTITGNSIYRLGEKLNLQSLNDGTGLVFDNALGDFAIDCRDGSKVRVDFNRLASTEEVEAGSPQHDTELTLGDLLDTINNSKDANGNGGKIKASISDDGKRIVLTDLTEGTHTTTMTQITTSPVLRTLGFIDSEYSNSSPLTSEDGVFTTRELLGDFDSVLMSTLNGGYGLSKATAGAIEVQDRAGNAATIEFTADDLKSMQTFNDVVNILNEKLSAEGIGITVQANDAKTGFQLVDTTGRTGSNLIFRDKTTTTTTQGSDGQDVTTTTSPNIAGSLGLVIDSKQSSVSGTSLNRQTVSYSTKLEDLNGGKGVTIAGG